MEALERVHLPFTGADSKFYSLDTLKTAIKKELCSKNSKTPKYVDLTNILGRENEILTTLKTFQMPVIVKPAISGKFEKKK